MSHSLDGKWDETNFISQIGQMNAATGNKLAKGSEGTTFAGNENGSGHGIVLPIKTNIKLFIINI
jgi:hypothetical protein